MLVLGRVVDDDGRGLAAREIVEVGARIELDLVADDAGAALAGRGRGAVTVRTAPSSTSVSLASTSTRTGVFSPVVAVSGLATGSSLVPVTVIAIVAERSRHARPECVADLTTALSPSAR